ncbi:unnamed protein product [Diatraea saccharalis]|uniref:RRM domain-containing protein n=1 Tax=Diatraea saccharalis TaxID=40085 RepID=A0A9N9WD99_9NEOP|nr:unnamed protein product [Diatraea saccharalis]
MAIVELQKLPPSVKMPKLMYSIRGILRKGNLNSRFWVTEIADMRTSDCKEAKLEFATREEAWDAKEILNQYPFRNGNDRSIITARIFDEKHNINRHPSPYRNRGSKRSRSRSRGNFYSRYSMDRDRSRSPLYHDTSELDLEIELLRKKRLVIEEERRLLLEQKKLDMLRERGPNASDFYDDMERSRDRKKRPRREMDEVIRNARPHKPHLPQFKKPCRILTDQMSSLIDKHSTCEETKMLTKLIVAQLRRRLAVELENKDFIPANKIVDLYRSKYPQSSDEEFIMPIIKNLRLSHWSLSNPKKKDNDQKNNQMEISEKAQVDPGSSTPADKVRNDQTHSCEPNIKIKVELNKSVKEEAVVTETMKEIATVELKRESTLAEEKKDTTIVEQKQVTTTKKPCTTTEGKETTATPMGKKDTSTAEGKKETTTIEGKKESATAEGKTETTTEGKESSTAEGKNETTTEGKKKTTTAEGKTETTTEGKKETSPAERKEIAGEVMENEPLEAADAEMLGAADEDWFQDGVDWTDGDSEEEEADENTNQ